jgi:hypothetical protein
VINVFFVSREHIMGNIDYLSVINVIIWPAVVLIALIAFKQEIASFFGQLQRAKIGPVQFEAFDRFVARGQSSLSAIERLNIEIARSRITGLEASSTLMELTSVIMPGRAGGDTAAKIKSHVEALRQLMGEIDNDK